MRLLNDHPLTLKENAEALAHEWHDAIILGRVDRDRTSVPWRHVQRLSCFCKQCRKAFTVRNYFEDADLKARHEGAQEITHEVQG